MAKESMQCVLLLLLLAASEGDCLWNTTIYVSGGGTDSPACWNNGGIESACLTLEFAAEGITNSTRIILASGNHTLNATITVAWKHDVAFTGATEDVYLSCITVGGTQGPGLHIENTIRLFVANLTFLGCGSLANSTVENSGTIVKVRSAIYILNSTNVTIESSQFVDGIGVGVILYDVTGTVKMESLVFSRNAVPEEEKAIHPGGFGVYIEHTYCTPGLTSACNYHTNPFNSASEYFIRNTLFSHNKGNSVHREFVPDKGRASRVLGRGGGLMITLKGASTSNTFEISGCRFLNNTALDGGGVWISLQDFASQNSFLISQSLFQDNHVQKNGGSFRIGIEFYDCDHCVSGNDIRLEGVQFVRNSAALGGAVDVFSSQMSVVATNTLSFSGCSWVNNTATVASAVMLTPEAWNSLTDGYLPTPVFDNCTFTGNKVLSTDPELFMSAGALFISTSVVNFTSSVVFSGNTGSAIYINAGSINVLENTSVVFDGNQGDQGGALAMLGFSAIRTFRGSSVLFVNNQATDVGGAIYSSSTDETDYYFSRSCFLRFSDNIASPDEWEVEFHFVNNSAKRYGHSIYATSLLPCARAAAVNSSEDINVTDVFLWRPFHYFNPEAPYNIASDPSTILLNVSIPISPGEIVNLKPISRDDLNNSIKSVYKASLSNSIGSVQIDSSFQYVSDGNIRITGNVNSSFQLNLQSIGFHQVRGSVNVTLTNCPPGFVLHKNSSDTQCICSTSTNHRRYEGITQCDYQRFRAFLNKGFWAGCFRGDLVTSECPLGYCRYVPSDEAYLPLNNTCQALDDYLCGARNRMGLLCGDCLDNYTVHFHSQRYLCAKCKNGHLGWLFYLLSELLPVILLFLFIVTFNVSLTSGYANCFILFAQVLDFFEVNSLGTFSLPDGVETLTSIYRFIFGIFNLDFFRFDELSFCLWDGATVLDVLAFKYITTAFALGLILLLIVFYRYLSCRCFPKQFSFQSTSVIHGITAFLIVSYAQCAKVSFQLLTRIQLMGQGVVGVKSVVFLSGTTEFFSKDHLPYAIPAILVLVFFCTLPPFLLLVYPAFLKIVAFPRVEKVYQCLSCKRFRPLQTLKPVLDSFQGCYKDGFRFFAGLYFVYRLLLAAAFAFTTNAIEFYICLEMIVVLMLALHAIMQPYIRRFYNVVDTILFANLAAINGISLYDYYWAQYQSTHRDRLVVASSIQVILIYVPIFYIAFLVVLKLAARNSRLRHKMRNLNRYLLIYTDDEPHALNYTEITVDTSTPATFDPSHLPARLFELEDSRSTATGNYGTVL